MQGKLEGFMKKCIASVCMMIGALVLATGCGAQKEASSKVRMACFSEYYTCTGIGDEKSGYVRREAWERL